MSTLAQIKLNGACLALDVARGRFDRARFHAAGLRRAVSGWLVYTGTGEDSALYWPALGALVTAAAALAWAAVAS